jgi:hypothetical protein
MSSLFVRGLSLCVLLGCGGCGASASVASTRAADVQARYARIYLSVEQGSADIEYADTLTQALSRELARHGVTVKSRIRRGIDLDENVVADEIAAWQPDGVLILDFAGGGGAGSTLEDATYDVSLLDAASQQRIWRAQARSVRRLGTTSGMMESTAEEITVRLAQDRLIAAPR